MQAQSLQSRLIEAIRESGLSPADLARAAKTTTATVSNWTGGKVRAEHAKAEVLFRIADALNVDPRWLLDGDRSSVREPSPAYGHSVDAPYLREAILLVQTVIQDMRSQPSPEAQSMAIMTALEMLSDGASSDIVKRFTLRLLQAVMGLADSAR